MKRYSVSQTLTLDSIKQTSPKALTEKSYAFPSCHSIQQTLAFSLEPGDRVEADEAIAQIETDKVTIDIASPWCDPRVSCQARRYCRTGKQGSYTK
ncbi:PREDICTED: uncharacterized protein LOC106298927 isoform X3 [Brassica oleracea var. oleracea]|uniref:uncharacterized protein LOC106298927 isoform X3 n=1 Tax=Brassica oleracea var. oleracea TaxID=109376 RepID=UPI0006A74EB6|nr:PREDICTED: uncharacterized protein LOC106298927 isoform X3 [Brassica oleracea var. oleracea]